MGIHVMHTCCPQACDSHMISRSLKFDLKDPFKVEKLDGNP